MSFALVIAIASFTPFFGSIVRLVRKGGQGYILHMGERGGGDEIGRVGGETENGEISGERFFTVGEVVEFWEGAFVCGKRSAFRLRLACFCQEGGRKWGIICN
jgi:hypothetical protein